MAGSCSTTGPWRRRQTVAACAAAVAAAGWLLPFGGPDCAHATIVDVDEAADVCATAANPCLIAEPVTVKSGATLDFGLRGEPDLTLRDLVDHLEGRQFTRPPEIERLFTRHEASYRPAELQRLPDGRPDLSTMKGIVWRRGTEIVVNPDRPFIADLDDLPVPMFELLPLHTYLMPLWIDVRSARLPRYRQALHPAVDLSLDRPLGLGNTQSYLFQFQPGPHGYSRG